MKWNKLEYGKWPKGDIVLRIKDGYVSYEAGRIDISPLDNKVYFIETNYGLHTILNIDSINDLDPYYIKLDDLEMPS